MDLFSTGLSITYHLAHSVLNVINASLPPIPVYVVFPKVLFLSPYTFHYVHLSSLLVPYPYLFSIIKPPSLC